MNKEQLLEIVELKEPQLTQVLEALEKTFTDFQINTPLRQSHFLAQVIHESGEFKYMKEIWGNTPAQQAYDTRVDLGNTPEKDGDGFKYRGRGWIQLTGKANYRAFSKDVKLDFLNNPDLVAQYPYVALAAGWFWVKKGLNTLADKDDIAAITKRINGGYNGLDDRKKYLALAKKALL